MWNLITSVYSPANLILALCDHLCPTNYASSIFSNRNVTKFHITTCTLCLKHFFDTVNCSFKYKVMVTVPYAELQVTRQEWTEVKLHSFLILSISWSWVVSLIPRLLHPKGNSPRLLSDGAAWAPQPVWILWRSHISSPYELRVDPRLFVVQVM